MREFFKGWKRKVGCVTLGLACVLAAGWVRSQAIIDIFVLTTGEKTALYLTSNQSALALSQHSDIIDPSPYQAAFYNWVSFPLQSDECDLPRESASIKWKYMLWGFGFGKVEMYVDGSRAEIGLIPYWSIVLPLPLLSAWLLLSKPRPAPKQTIEPTSLDPDHA